MQSEQELKKGPPPPLAKQAIAKQAFATGFIVAIAQRSKEKEESSSSFIATSFFGERSELINAFDLLAKPDVFNSEAQRSVTSVSELAKPVLSVAQRSSFSRAKRGDFFSTISSMGLAMDNAC